jgi:hypothetical protein
MALSASNVLSVPYRIVGNQKETCYDVTFDNSYLEGGEACAPSLLGLSNIERTTCTIQKVGGTVNVVAASRYEEKLHLFDETPAEVASGADVSNIVIRCVARGN